MPEWPKSRWDQSRYSASPSLGAITQVIMTTPQNDQVDPAPATTAPSHPGRGHHVPALIVLWILIIIASYFIWPSKSYLSGEQSQNTPTTQSSP